ncbi:MAG: hypothetical protein IH986_01710 [Planctomycetes bacterium]|nr:hypothetical protein [Planctomycetota bacterium]
MLFVLLEHTVEHPRPGAHWDLMIELPGREKLATWRLAHDPITHVGAIEAVRIGEHRRVYLHYEGDIGGGRGSVRRVDRGESVLLESSEERIVVELRGAALRGRCEIAHVGEGARFRRLDR